MIRVVRGTVDENAEEAAVGTTAAPTGVVVFDDDVVVEKRDGLVSLRGGVSRAHRDEIAALPADLRLLEERRLGSNPQGRRTAHAPVEDLRRTREGWPPGRAVQPRRFRGSVAPLDAAPRAPPPPPPRPREPPAPSGASSSWRTGGTPSTTPVPGSPPCVARSPPSFEMWSGRAQEDVSGEEDEDEAARTGRMRDVPILRGSSRGATAHHTPPRRLP